MLNHSSLHQAILKIAIQEFLRHGYHGFSLQTCAEGVGLQKSSLYHYIHNKLDLAHQVMNDLEEQAATVICKGDDLFSLTAGPALALVPARLWSSGHPTLQQRIHSYYHDWRLHFIGSCQWKNVPVEFLINRGDTEFFTWLGFWIMQYISLKAELNPRWYPSPTYFTSIVSTSVSEIDYSMEKNNLYQTKP